MDLKDIPRLPRHPDRCSQEEWDDWQRRLTAFHERITGKPLKLTSVSRAGW